MKKDGIFVGKAEEMGMFKFGSTVVLIFESDKPIEWKVKEGDKAKYGQTICSVI